MKKIDLVGKQFGRWTVLSGAPAIKNESYWICECRCGTIKNVNGKNLRYKKSLSCGCLSLELKKQRIQHGRCRSPEYQAWSRIKNRCKNKNSKDWYLYGGRGIKVCERWETFENFYKDMGNRPTVNHSIDRINNNGDYEPANCRWATAIEQANNKRSNHLITFKGQTQTLTYWCHTLGLKFDTVERRINLLGWTPERALTTPTTLSS